MEIDWEIPLCFTLEKPAEMNDKDKPARMPEPKSALVLFRKDLAKL